MTRSGGSEKVDVETMPPGTTLSTRVLTTHGLEVESTSTTKAPASGRAGKRPQKGRVA